MVCCEFEDLNIFYLTDLTNWEIDKKNAMVFFFSARNGVRLVKLEFRQRFLQQPPSTIPENTLLGEI